MKKTTIFRALLALYFIALTLLCMLHLGSSEDIPTMILGIPTDKVAHFLMYVPMPLLTFWSFHKRGQKPYRLVLWLVCILAIGALIGGGIELLQGATGYRSCEIGDFRADCLGLLASTFALLLYCAISRRW